MNLSPNTTLLYAISNRRLLFSPDEMFCEGLAQKRLLQFAKQVALAEIDLFQLREKDLPVRTICEIGKQLVEIFKNTKTQMLINDRFDVALAIQADGVHLTTTSLNPSEVRRCVPKKFLIGSSVHNLKEISIAEQGANFTVCGPIFNTQNKNKIGIEKFLELVNNTTLPMLALGGVNKNNVSLLKETRAAGVAGISFFTENFLENDEEKFLSSISDLRNLL